MPKRGGPEHVGQTDVRRVRMARATEYFPLSQADAESSMGWVRRVSRSIPSASGMSMTASAADGRPSGVFPITDRFTVVAKRRDGCMMVPFSRSKRKFRCEIKLYLI